jgi:hypothetical protein
MMSASAWFDAPASLFWATLVLVVIGIATLVITALTWVSGITRRRLICSIVSRTPIFSVPEEMLKDLEVSYRGRNLIALHVTVVDISNVGRSSIPSTSFDKERDIVFEVGVPVVEILTVEHRPAWAPTPCVLAVAHSVHLRPDLIAKDEIITVSFLTEEPVDIVDIAKNPLNDVVVEIKDREAWLKQRAKRQQLLTSIASSCISLALCLGLGYFAGANHANYSAFESLLSRERKAAFADCIEIGSIQEFALPAFRNTYSDVKIVQGTNKHFQRVQLSPTFDEDTRLATEAYLELSFTYNVLGDFGGRLGAASDWYNVLRPALEGMSQLQLDPTEADASGDLAAISKVATFLSDKKRSYDPLICQRSGI